VTAILQIPRTLFGVGAIARLGDELDQLGLNRPLVVTDKGVARAGLLDQATSALGSRVGHVFDEVTENNVFADADTGAAIFGANGCDCVVGLGGGSVLDTAKCIAVLAACGGRIAEYTLDPVAPINDAAPIIAIPTTAGTGSDADIYAGIHPDNSSPGVGIASYRIIPRVAILDPALTKTLPARLTAATGIDALSHCIEGYLSKEDVPFAKLIAMDGLRRGVNALGRAVANGEDMAARSEMLLVAYAGGVAMSMGTGPAHAIALTCSDQGFPHGILSGIGIVMTLDRALARMPNARMAIGNALNADPGQSPASAFAGLMRSVGLPTRLAELGYRCGDIGRTALSANQHFLNGFAHLPPTLEDYTEMFQCTLT